MHGLPELIVQPLEPERAQELRKWLAKPEASTLRQVLAGRCIHAQNKAWEAAMRSDTVNAYSDVAAIHVKEGQLLRSVLELLDEISKPETELELIKLK